MARRKRQRTRVVLGLLVAAAAVAAILWLGRERWIGRFAGGSAGAPVEVRADHVDPANEGRRVRVAGRLEGAQRASDTQLGVAAAAAILFRDVAIYQWHEHCDGGDCRYDMAWSSAAVDSRKFRHPAAHENPPPPFASARFAAPGLHLGAFAVDAELAASQLHAAPLAVTAADLPPNLAATFRAVGGALFAGDDAEHPQVGALKVSYRVVAPGEATLSGIQRGNRLESR